MSVLFTALYAKCPYYLLFYMQSADAATRSFCFKRIITDIDVAASKARFYTDLDGSQVDPLDGSHAMNATAGCFSLFLAQYSRSW